MQFGLDDKTQEKIKSVFAKFTEINTVVLYGSRAKGNYRPGSDIDLTIKDSSLNLTQLNAVKSALDDLSTPYMFDLSIYEQLTSAELIEHINRVGVVFYEKA
jgi:predicted nucleotidyltransferase